MKRLNSVYIVKVKRINFFESRAKFMKKEYFSNLKNIN